MKTTEKKSGTLYITDNDDSFPAPDNFSQEEYEKNTAVSGEGTEEEQKNLLETIRKRMKEISYLEKEYEKKFGSMPDTEINEKAENNRINNPIQNDGKENLMKETLPSFYLNTVNGLKYFEGMKIKSFLEDKGLYVLENESSSLTLPEPSLKAILHPERDNKESMKSMATADAVDGHPVVTGQTVIPEFALLTPKGIREYRNLKLYSFNAAEKSYNLSDGESSLTVSEETFLEITKPDRFRKTYGENTKPYEKLPESVYSLYFEKRKNTADNFMHNLSVYCRKEANSPLDALEIAKKIIDGMDNEEKKKTRSLLRNIARDDRDINSLIVSRYYEAVKDFPLDKGIINDSFKSSTPSSFFPDTISTKGQQIDQNSKLRIGDMVKDMAFVLPSLGGRGREMLYEDLTVISSSMEKNNVILMDGNKSFYEVPRDTLLEGYNRQQEKQMKAELKQHKSNRIDISWER